MTAEHTWKVGDRVQWTHKTQRGSSIELSTWEGTILGLEGAVAVIKRRKRYRVHVSRLRAKNDRGELTDLVLGDVHG